MKRSSIRNHLRIYSIFNRRRTTINHAFASALAPTDTFDDRRIAQAISDLGQNPDGELRCFYCDERTAQTWDHVHGLVKDGQYAGFGHTLGNLVPCCNQCNSAKGNKDWRRFLEETIGDEGRRAEKIATLTHYIEKYCPPKLDQAAMRQRCPELMRDFEDIQRRILETMLEADQVAASIRDQIRAAQGR